MRLPSIVLAALGTASMAFAQNAALLLQTTDAGGRSTSADYILDSTLGSFGGVILQSSDATVRSGYSGELNEPPTLQPKTLQRAGAISAKMRLDFLLQGAVDLEGDDFSLLNVDASSLNGSPIFSFEGWLFYNSTLASPDQAAYRVIDSYGMASAETISILNIGPGASQTFLRTELLNGGPSRRVYFAGIPGRSYIIEVTATLQPPNWQNVANATAGLNGIYTFDDTTGQQTRFYRAVLQP